MLDYRSFYTFHYVEGRKTALFRFLQLKHRPFGELLSRMRFEFERHFGIREALHALAADESCATTTFGQNPRVKQASTQRRDKGGHGAASAAAKQKKKKKKHQGEERVSKFKRYERAVFYKRSPRIRLEGQLKEGSDAAHALQTTGVATLIRLAVFCVESASIKDAQEASPRTPGRAVLASPLHGAHCTALTQPRGYTNIFAEVA